MQPILTRYGCNSGGCHGKLAGQNGFRLSLRGYAPEDDYRALTEEEFGRRIDPLNPAQSLMLLKATGQLTHGGGKLFGVDDPPYAALLDWLRRGVAGIVEDEPRVTRIAASPSTKIIAPGDSLGITVQAEYSDEATRDVTALAQLHCNDGSFAEVTPEGEVTALRHGEVSIVVSFEAAAPLSAMCRLRRMRPMSVTGCRRSDVPLLGDIRRLTTAAKKSAFVCCARPAGCIVSREVGICTSEA